MKIKSNNETKKKSIINKNKKKWRETKKNRKLFHIHGKRLPKKNGWIRIKIEGNAFERGFAHGYLLSTELQETKDAFAFILKANGIFTSISNYEKYCRENITPKIQEFFPEFFEEMQGISAGAIAAGNIEITFDFIVSWNSLLSTYTIFPERCSAFISIQDGNIIMAHNTHTDFLTGQKANIIMEICPLNGNRMIMQTCPGFICSGTDWFMIENGIIGCECTISNINYTPKFGIPYFCRIRQAMQYGNSLDDYVKLMLEKNAGDYPCTWLLGDIEKKEIMQFEIGLKYHSVERKKEGVFYGMNSVHDKTIREKETNDKDYGNTLTSSGARNMRFHYLLYEKYAKKMNIENAKKTIADHYDVYLDKETDGNNRTICKHINPNNNYPFGAIDGKIVDTNMAKKMTFLGRFGNSCGTDFNIRKYIQKYPKYKVWEKYLKNMPSQPWTELKPI
jgi:hypothetical protein